MAFFLLGPVINIIYLYIFNKYDRMLIVWDGREKSSKVRRTRGENHPKK